MAAPAARGERPDNESVTITVQGIAAVLGCPMRERPFIFGPLHALPLTEGTRVYFGDRRAGTVTRLWADGPLVHWAGVLDDDPPECVWTGDDVSIAVPEPRPAVLIATGALVGIPAYVSGRTEQQAGHTVVSGWSLERMDLVRSRPWPEVTLRLTGEQEAVGARAGAV